ncbi:hypothetical protein LEM8419_01012 [Neolewinella maritima]|uniref:DUF3140 domain-containing protein n=1 Tax=Neolewinella maritima TaxID=1383882 RepID=A0ABM9AYX5_9BACT|nr:DUF3140 domain-containing protein [Neolewinella maritima]CAH0999712.1 hypothetical protein LEM8419_01012 [Neolewinella maritima]
MADKSHEEIYQEFKDVVNMAPQELEDWLQTEESKSVGDTSGSDKESTGHKSGKRIIEIKRTKKAELTDDDYKHMNKVVGYVHRHLAQKPKQAEGSDWAYSLKNWGHDPTK